MAKDAYYFPHEYNARHDPKCEELDIDFGNRGYGMYWKLVEIFSEQGGSVPVSRLRSLAHELREPIEDVLKVLDEYDLFQRETIDGVEFFTSRAIRKRLEHRAEVVEQKRAAGRRSAEVRKALAEANARKSSSTRSASDEQSMNGCSTDVQTDVEQGKEIKGKEKKEDKSSLSSKESKKKGFVAPTVQEVKAYIEEKGYAVDAESFVAFYESKGWKVGSTPMKSWQSAVVTWHKRNNNSNGNGNLNQRTARGRDPEYVPDYSNTKF